MLLLYIIFGFIILSAEILGWAPQIRFYNLVPFAYSVNIVIQVSSLLKAWRGNFTLTQIYPHLVPFAFLVVITREAHMMVALLFFAGTMLIFLQVRKTFLFCCRPALKLLITWQIGNATNPLRANLCVYTVLLLAVYLSAVGFSEWFYSDSVGRHCISCSIHEAVSLACLLGTDSWRGRVLHREIKWGEEMTFVITVR